METQPPNRTETHPAFDGLAEWEPVEIVEGAAVPFDDRRDESPADVLLGKESAACPECRSIGVTSCGTCPTCRGFGEVVPYFGGFLARDGLARFY
jgi:hypothetical protein